MADIIQLRRDTANNWIAVDPVLADGEMGFEKDTKNSKSFSQTGLSKLF